MVLQLIWMERLLTYLWTQRSGSPATLNNQNTENVTISNLAEGTYVFRLTVIDNDGASDFDEVVVTGVSEYTK